MLASALLVSLAARALAPVALVDGGPGPRCPHDAQARQHQLRRALSEGTAVLPNLGCHPSGPDTRGAGCPRAGACSEIKDRVRVGPPCRAGAEESSAIVSCDQRSPATA